MPAGKRVVSRRSQTRAAVLVIFAILAIIVVLIAVPW